MEVSNDKNKNTLPKSSTQDNRQQMERYDPATIGQSLKGD